MNRDVLAQAENATRVDRIVLDMDSSESPVHGAQEGSAYNGHFESVCYHPLFLFTEHGDCLAATLRPGNVHSADDWDDLLLPEIDRQQAAGTRVAFRADAAFAKPEIYDALEQRGVDYAIRMPANKNLELEIEDVLFRPPGRPSCKPLVRFKSFHYQAKSWTTPRRIVAKVEHHRGELFPRVGFIVTNMVLPSRSVVRFYNKRGTAEQWIKEGKQATHWTRLSCHRFRANEVRLQLSVLAYNLGNLWRRLVLPPRNQALVAHESPAAAGEDRGAAGEACAVLLAPAGGRASDPAAFRRDAAEDLGATGAGRLTRGLSATKPAWRRNGTRVERCLRNALKAGAPVGRTSARAEVTASGAGRMCDDKSFVRSAALRVYKGPSGAGKTEIPANLLYRQLPSCLVHQTLHITPLNRSLSARSPRPDVVQPLSVIPVNCPCHLVRMASCRLLRGARL